MSDPSHDSYDNGYDAKRAWNYALWLLGRQSYTGAQVAKKLAGKGATPETIEQVLGKLAELKLIDDALYAESYVRSRSRNKGALRLRQELFHKGVAEGLVEKALGELDEAAQVETALSLLKKNLWRWKGEPRERYAKAYAYLARRGYPVEVAREALGRSSLSS